MEKYILSIVVTCYNDGRYIEECLQSVIKQCTSQIEIICVDDGSTDESLKKINAFSKYLNILKVNKNSGLSNARNIAIRSAKGDYLMFVDGDDYISLNTIEYFLPILIDNKADVVMGLIEEFKDSPEAPNTWNDPVVPSSIFNGLRNEEILLNLHKYGLKIAPAQKYIVKKTLITTNNLWFQNILHEDQLWTPQALCLAEHILYCDFKFYFHRVRLCSLGSRFDECVCESYFYICKKLLDFSKNIVNEDKKNFLKERCQYLFQKMNSHIKEWNIERRKNFLSKYQATISSLQNKLGLKIFDFS